MSVHFTNYDNTVEYLYSLQKHGIKLGLDNIKELMRILGQPQKAYRSIHIAGTNGKGSTAVAISSILISNGIKVGLFTSPHLVSFTERIRINNQCIGESDVINLASDIRQVLRTSNINPTFFEFVTALAFFYFALNKIDWAVIETGMGGRLDATNVLEPEITIITNVSRDHSEFLGRSITEISSEKAGIIKPLVPIITASKNDEAIKILTEEASAKQSALHIYDRDYKGNLLSMDDEILTFNYEGFKSYEKLMIPLTGAYQLENACMAIRSCELLNQSGIDISDSSIRKGLSTVNLEGRLEYVSKSPPIILDGAHNSAAANSLATAVKDLFPGKKLILIMGIMDDKDIQDILNPLVKISEYVILTKAKYDRAASPKKLKHLVIPMLDRYKSISPGSVKTSESVSQALDIAKSLCKKDHIILVTGSFYTTGEAKEVLGQKGILTTLRE